MYSVGLDSLTDHILYLNSPACSNAYSIRYHAAYGFYRSFVETYDMKEHSAKIFYDIVTAIGSFIQTLFMPAVSNHQPVKDILNKSGDTQTAAPSLVAGIPVGGGVTPQPAFVYKNLWIPLIMNVPQTPIKPIL